LILLIHIYTQLAEPALVDALLARFALISFHFFFDCYFLRRFFDYLLFFFILFDLFHYAADYHLFSLFTP